MTTESSSPAASVSAFTAAAARVAAGEDPGALAAELVAQMTLDEKLGCLSGDEDFWPGVIRMAGAGAARVAGEGYSGRPYVAARVERLGIPGIAFADGPRGVVVGPNTCFPVSMARGATFDPDLEERIGDAIGRELRARGANLYGGVCVNLLRHPAWGRAQETYGEDPLLVGEMGAALTRGVQRHAMACVKHFACNSIENARFKVDIRVDDRTLHEVYLSHFQRVVGEGVACVMSAYNSLNGAWCGENRRLLTEILREEWGFDGFVISDWIFGLRDGVKSVKAGLDIEMPFRMVRVQDVAPALASGELTEADIDAPVKRVVATLLRFDEILSQAAPDASVVASDTHRRLACEAAVKSIVLLKNADGLLPLDASRLKRIAVLGRLAGVPNLGDRGSSSVSPPSTITPLDGLREALPGVELVVPDGVAIDDPARAAANAEVAIVVVGCTYEDEGEYISPQPDLLRSLAPPRPDDLSRPERPPVPAGEERPARREPPPSTAGDRLSLELSAADQALVRAAAAANPRTIAVLMGGSAIMVEGWEASVPAILMAWYPGMEGGRALADVLLGRVEPSGRLPFAVPTDADHLAPFDLDATAITYDGWHGQWLLDRDGHAARYPFGFGLSYSRTSMASAYARVEGDQIMVEVVVRNEGSRPAPEVVQVYAGMPGSRFERPARRLVGFARAEPAPGETTALRLAIPKNRLAVYTDRGWTVEAGDYRLVVARHAADPEAVTLTVAVTAGGAS